MYSLGHRILHDFTELFEKLETTLKRKTPHSEVISTNQRNPAFRTSKIIYTERVLKLSAILHCEELSYLLTRNNMYVLQFARNVI